MKIKHRALALILSAIMVLTFMPALAFAEGEMFSGEEISGGTIALGTAMEVDIEESYDYYSFVFTPDKSDWYTFSSSGDIDTFGRVVEGTDEICEDDSDGGNDNFACRFYGEEGSTYYLQATCWGSGTGSFRVSVNETEDGWWLLSTSERITFNPGDSSVTLNAEQCWAWKGEKPNITYCWYQNVADPEADTYEWEEMDGEDSSQITVSANYNEYKCVLTDSEEVTEEIYFYVREYDDDDYDDEEPNNEYFGRVVATGTIKAGEVKNATVSNPHDYVSYEFTPTVSGRYSFRSTGGNDGYGRVLDENSELVAWDDDMSEADHNFCISFYAEEGHKYYLQGCLFGSSTGALTVELLDGSFGKDGEWWCEYDFGEYDFTAGGVSLEVELAGDVPESGLKYEWFRKVNRASNNVFEKISGATGPSYKATTAGDYKCEVTEYSASGTRIHGDALTFSITVPPVLMNGMQIVEMDDMSAFVSTTRSENPTLDGYSPDAKGNISIPASVKFADNVTRKVTEIRSFKDCKALTGITIPSTVEEIIEDAFVNTGLKSITIPETVKDIGEYAVGYNRSYNESTDDYVYTKVAGFTIFGKTGSAAQAYAKANGFAFRDLAAEQAAAAAAAAKAKEAARQGTPDGSLPKVKLSKPAAKKTSITVKWKKLTKKQLKKSKATHYEIWVSESSTYPAGATTKEMIVKKSKSKWTCKGLTKNKRYFVQIRAIKYVGGVKHVGPWKQRTIKTKKK